MESTEVVRDLEREKSEGGPGSREKEKEKRGWNRSLRDFFSREENFKLSSFFSFCFDVSFARGEWNRLSLERKKSEGDPRSREKEKERRRGWNRSPRDSTPRSREIFFGGGKFQTLLLFLLLQRCKFFARGEWNRLKSLERKKSEGGGGIDPLAILRDASRFRQLHLRVTEGDKLFYNGNRSKFALLMRGGGKEEGSWDSSFQFPRALPPRFIPGEGVNFSRRIDRGG